MTRYWRKVIHVAAEDSPNVRLGLKEVKDGGEPTYTEVTPGLVSYANYLKRRATWDPMMQCIGLDGRFYQGADILLFPPERLDAAVAAAEQLGDEVRPGEYIGLDSAEGGDNTAAAVVDRYGLLALESRKTPDTSVIPDWIVELLRRWRVPPDHVLLDAGGGGYEHANRLRRMGYPVRAVRFGAGTGTDPKRGMSTVKERQETLEVRYAYRNIRTEMYHLLSQHLHPSGNERAPWAIPGQLLNRPRVDGGASLRRQLAVLPKWCDEQGRYYLPPKQLRADAGDSSRQSITKILGCSPDEADAVVLACYGLWKPRPRRRAGVLTG